MYRYNNYEIVSGEDSFMTNLIDISEIEHDIFTYCTKNNIESKLLTIKNNRHYDPRGNREKLLRDLIPDNFPYKELLIDKANYYWRKSPIDGQFYLENHLIRNDRELQDFARTRKKLIKDLKVNLSKMVFKRIS